MTSMTNAPNTPPLASRKFLLAMAALGATAYLCAAGHIHEGVYSAVVIAPVGAYITGNVVQKSAALKEAAKNSG